ncbi:MAG TPA: hypothetical protein VGE05_15505 [Novosphingobium sp.]
MTGLSDDPLFRKARSDARKAERRDYYAEKLIAKRKSERPPACLPILRPSRLKAVIARVETRFRNWRRSPFEHEAGMRSGLRAAFCLLGYDWARSDHEAAIIVAAALKNITPRRPRWEEGQREYVIPAESCCWCGRGLDVRLDLGSRRYRYCDEVCAGAAHSARDCETTLAESKMHIAALEMIRKKKRPALQCGNPACGKAFHSENASARYCCKECQVEGRRIQPNPKRKCGCCGKRFRSQDPAALFCSMACYRKRDRAPKLLTHCEWCGGGFLAKTEDARFCCSSHRSASAMLRSGKWKPKRISAQIFDFYVTVPVNEFWCRAA